MAMARVTIQAKAKRKRFSMSMEDGADGEFPE
jgi:hypothetical protein